MVPGWLSEHSMLGWHDSKTISRIAALEHSHLPKIDDSDAIPEEFDEYWQEEKVLALGKTCEDENVDQKQFQAHTNAYIFTEQEPLREDIVNASLIALVQCKT